MSYLEDEKYRFFFVKKHKKDGTLENDWVKYERKITPETSRRAIVHDAMKNGGWVATIVEISRDQFEQKEVPN